MLAADYNRNPRLLLPDAAKSTTGGAVAGDLPITCTGATQVLDLHARLRAAQTHGLGGTATDYQYADLSWQGSAERTTAAAGASWHHDSTFYNPLENTFQLMQDLLRTERQANAHLDHSLSERGSVALSAAWDRVGYEAVANSSLFDFWYAQASASATWLLSERSSATISSGASRYFATNSGLRNDSPFAQLAVRRQLRERISANFAVGYSGVHSLQRAGQLEFTRSYTTTTFNASLQADLPRSTWSATLGRSLQPTGYGSLLTQDEVTLAASRSWGERFSMASQLRATRLRDSLGLQAYGNRQYLQFAATANWRMDERWTASLALGHQLQRADPALPVTRNSGVSLSLTRRFGRASLS